MRRVSYPYSHVFCRALSAATRSASAFSAAIRSASACLLFSSAASHSARFLADSATCASYLAFLAAASSCSFICTPSYTALAADAASLSSSSVFAAAIAEIPACFCSSANFTAANFLLSAARKFSTIDGGNLEKNTSLSQVPGVFQTSDETGLSFTRSAHIDSRRDISRTLSLSKAAAFFSASKAAAFFACSSRAVA